MSIFGQGTSLRLEGLPNRKPEQLLPFHSALVAPEWDWYWRNATSVIPFWEGQGSPYDIKRKKFLVRSGPIWATTKEGIAGHSPNVADDYGVAPTDEIIPTDQVTIVMVRRVLDTTLRVSGAFGSVVVAAGEHVQAHVPFSDGNVYWDFGGQFDPNRSVWSGYTKNVDILDVFIFKAGKNGSTIWYNGIERASTGSAITRTNMTDQWNINLIAGANGDLQSHILFSIHDDEWSNAECLLFYNDPFGPIRTSVRPLFLPAEAPPPLDVAQMLSPTPRWDNRMRFY